jgi:RNA polymerase sigma-70 factor (ECF subfamily)
MPFSTFESPTRATLIARVRDLKDQQAWDEFVVIYGPFIYRICRRAGLDESDAEDTTQEVFSCVLKAIPEFEYERERGGFRAWLKAITRHEVADTLARRQRARRPGRTVESPVEASFWEDGFWEEAFGDHVRRVALERVRQRCTKRAWVIFKLTWVRELPAERVAQRLKLPVARVFESKCRVLKQFKQEVAVLAEDAAALVPPRGCPEPAGRC